MRKLCIFIVMAVLLPVCLFGQDSMQHKTGNKWYVPDFGVIQYAGSIGLISAGAGYTIFRGKANVDVLAGYVPASLAGGSSLETITLKLTTAPWRIVPNNRVTIRPISFGMYFCYTPGRQYSSDLPAWYPDGYYWWSEALRANLFLGGNISLTTPKARHIQRAELYYELGTNEIKLVSYIQNSGYLNVAKILHIGIGMRFHLVKK